jgi:steroid 5-alpha reductase family enzyme
MTPIPEVTLIAATVCALAWVASLITGDTSWVDRIWSIVPAVYVWVFALFAHLDNERLDVMAIAVTVWGARLTFNFARRGGYSGVEDYRWSVLRASMPRWQFQLFNFFFIVLYQNFLLVLIAMPAYTAYQHRGTSFSFLDLILVAIFLACTLGETIADQQQWNFQSNKHREIAAGRVPAEQFLQTGLFRYSRHPNYFFELAQWWLVFLLGAVAARSVMEWTVIGVVLLTALFIGSTSFTEKITLSKYPEYSLYQQRTSAVIPWSPRRQRRTAEAFDAE